MILAATCLKIGHIKYLKGTFGTIFAIPFFYIFHNTSILVQFFVFLIIFIIGLISSEYYEFFYNKKDPGNIVIDEVAAYFLLLIFIKFNLLNIFLSFILFRFFDIAKVYPANKIEAIKGGAGIMLDDIIAAFYTLFIVLITGQFI
jgi:phosphatidylglycerophosphatase A